MMLKIRVNHINACFIGLYFPKNKYHAINSVYYIFSIQVYITFLSIHVHIIIHIVLLWLLGCISVMFKVLVNFGSQLYCLQFVKHSCNMSTLLCVCGLRGGGGWWVGSSHMTGPSVLEVFHTNAAVSPHSVQSKSLRGRRGGDSCRRRRSCQLHVGLRSHCCGQDNRLFLTSQFCEDQK